MEPRVLLDAVFWTGAAGDNLWHNPANWFNNDTGTAVVPTADDDVTIDVPQNPTILFNSTTGDRAVRSLTAHEHITFSGGMLTVGQTATVDGATVTMSGGTLSSGTWNLLAGAVLRSTSAGGTLINVEVHGDLWLDTSGAVIRLEGTTSFDAARLAAGGVDLQMAPGYVLNSLVVAEGTSSLTRFITLAHGGPGTVTFGPLAEVRLAAGSGGSLIVQNSSAATLVNQGLINAQAVGRTLTISTSVLSNQGTLSVTTGTLTVNASYWSNAGTVAGSGGVLNIGGGFNTAEGAGTFGTAAVTVNITGMIINAGNTLALNAATGSWQLSGGTINGGTLALTDGTALRATNFTGTLNDVQVLGELLLDTSSASMRLAGTTSFDAARLTASFAVLQMAAGYVLNSLVVVEGVATGQRRIDLAAGGAGTVTFGPTAEVRLAASSRGNLNITNISAATLLNQGLITAQAAERTLTISNTINFINQGTLSLSAFAATLTVSTSTFANQGMLNVSAGAVTISSSNWTNAGTVTGSAGSFTLRGNFDAAGGAGTFTTAALTVNISGTVNNAGNTLALNAATGSWRLLGGTINGGTMALFDGAVLRATSFGGTLENVQVQGELLLDTANTRLRLAGSTSFVAARLAASDASLQMAPGYVLNSLVVVEGAAVGTRTVDLAVGGAGTVTFGPAAEVRLAADSGGNLNIQNSATATLVNQGLITVQAGGRTLTISNSTFTNQGTLNVSASAGTLTVSSSNWTNAGTVTGSAGFFTILGNFDAAGGVGSFATAALTVTVSGTLSNAGNTLALNAATGSWRLLGGTINGGAVALFDGAILRGTSTGGTLESVQVQGELLLDTSNARMRLAGSTSFVAARLAASGASLQLAPGYVLNAPVVVDGADAGTRSIALAAGGPGTVTFGPAAEVRLAADSGGDLNIHNASAATLINEGLITVQAAGRTLTIGAISFTNAGALSALAGTLAISPVTLTNHSAAPNTLTGGAWIADGGTLAFGSRVITVNAADIRLGPGGEIAALSSLTVNSGSFSLLNGRGFAVPGSFTNSGTLWLSPGSVLAASIYVQTAAAMLRIEAAGGAVFGRIDALGSATLNGALEIVAVGGYNPARGENLQFITADSVSGTFAATSVPGVAPDLKAPVLYGPGGVRLLITSIADIDNDGVVNSTDISAFITLWLLSINNGTLDADFDGDGVVNSMDISAFITAWLNAL